MENCNKIYENMFDKNRWTFDPVLINVPVDLYFTINMLVRIIKQQP